MVTPCKDAPVEGQAALEAVAWIKDGPRMRLSTVAAVLPAGFEVYLRLFHRFSNDAGQWTTWSERAEAAGVRYHSQLSELALGLVISSSYSNAPWATTMGSIDAPSRRALSQVLSEQTGRDPVSMYFGISEEVRGRNPLIIELPISALLEDLVHPVLGERLIGPELIWPADRSWIVCSDYDLYATYIACDATLAGALSAHPDLEILPTTLDERTDYRRDLINCGPSGLSVPGITREPWQHHQEHLSRPDTSSSEGGTGSGA
jgi:hypothetical protein